MHGRGEIIRPVSGKGKGGLPRTASAVRIGEGSWEYSTTTPERKEKGEKRGRKEGGGEETEEKRDVE